MWPSVTFEEYPWKRNPDDLAFIPKNRRRKIIAKLDAPNSMISWMLW